MGTFIAGAKLATNLMTNNNVSKVEPVVKIRSASTRSFIGRECLISRNLTTSLCLRIVCLMNELNLRLGRRVVGRFASLEADENAVNYPDDDECK